MREVWIKCVDVKRWVWGQRVNGIKSMERGAIVTSQFDSV